GRRPGFGRRSWPHPSLTLSLVRHERATPEYSRRYRRLTSRTRPAGSAGREAVAVVGAQHGILEQTVADGAIELEPAEAIHEAVAARQDAGIGQVVGAALHRQRALVHAVAPVGLGAVAGAQREEAGGERLDRDDEVGPVEGPEPEPGRRDATRAGHELEL